MQESTPLEVLSSTVQPPARPACRKVWILILLLVGGGMLGLHRYAMGYRYWWVMALTLGGLSFWSLRDAIMVALDRMPMADGRPLRLP